MGNENELKIKITADSSEVQSGVEAGANAFTQSVDNIKGSVDGLNGVMATMAGFLGGALSVGAIKGAIDSTINYNGSVIQLSRVMGIGTEEASKLGVALKLIGGTTEGYAAMNLKLDRQVKQNSETLTQLGIKVRDNNGNLLTQTEIFNNAISTMAKYKAGADQDMFALTTFGRASSEVYKYQNLTNEVMEEGAKIAKDFGLIIGTDTAEDTDKMARESRVLGIEFDALKIKVGNELLPTFVELVNTLREMSGLFVIVTGPIKAVLSLLYGLNHVASDIGIYLSGSFHKAAIEANGLWAQLERLVHLDFKGAAAAQKATEQEVAKEAKATDAALLASAQKTSDALARIWGVTQEKVKSSQKALSGDQSMPDIKGQKQDLENEEKAIDTKISLAEKLTEFKKQELDKQYALGNISAANQVAQEIALDEKLKAEIGKYIAAYEALENKLPEHRQEIANKILQINQKMDLALEKDNRKLADEYQEDWNTTLNQINNKMASSLTQMLNGQKSFGQSLTQIWQQIEEKIINLLLTEVEKFKAVKDAEAAISKAFSELMIALGITQGAEEKAVAVGTSATVATANTAKAISGSAAAAVGAAESQADIPYVGPYLAIAAAAAMIGGLAGYVAGAGKSAAGGYDIPSGINPITQLHQEEMVLPANLANNIRSMSGRGGGGATHISIQALDTKSFMSREGRKVIKGLMKSGRSMGLNR